MSPAAELPAKMTKLGALYQALDVARATRDKQPDWSTAACVANLQRQIVALRDTLPAVRLAVANPDTHEPATLRSFAQ